MTLAWSLAVEGSSSYHFTTADVWGVLYQGVAVSGVCFSLWLILLGRYSASRLATVAFLTPLFGISFGALLRGEPLTWPLMAGAGLVGLGIWLVATGKAAAAEPAPIPADAPAAVSTT
jgi:drug/metabolite transporter (DMT)-like permease